MCACVHVCMCACVHVCMCACVHVCMCACVHMCTRTCVNVLLHTSHGDGCYRNGMRGFTKLTDRGEEHTGVDLHRKTCRCLARKQPIHRFHIPYAHNNQPPECEAGEQAQRAETAGKSWGILHTPLARRVEQSGASRVGRNGGARCCALCALTSAGVYGVGMGP
jgi:hypothetical protein